MRKPTFCICENKDADQLRGNLEADHRLCFRYIDSTIPLLFKSEISQKVGFLMMRLMIMQTTKAQISLQIQANKYMPKNHHHWPVLCHMCSFFTHGDNAEVKYGTYHQFSANAHQFSAKNAIDSAQEFL